MAGKHRAEDREPKPQPKPKRPVGEQRIRLGACGLCNGTRRVKGATCVGCGGLGKVKKPNDI